MVEAVAEYALAMRANEHPRWLSLFGTTGTGKTHCATRLFEWASDNMTCVSSFWPEFVYWPELIDSLKGSKREFMYDKFKEMRRWPFLALDDVFAERDPSGFAAERAINLLSSREGKWTVITSNLSLQAIAQIDARMASRMIRSANRVCDINTVDYSLR
jgi:DNA replication protein DnaC